MIPPEVATLRDILLKGVNVTNSERQATGWAFEIIKKMQEAGYMIERIDAGADT
jgi:DNA-directed RNA polymerase specialized sigma54-like protein